jgi:hypothetical protein
VDAISWALTADDSFANEMKRKETHEGSGHGDENSKKKQQTEDQRKNKNAAKMTSGSQKAETFSVTVQQTTTLLAVVALQIRVQERLIPVGNVPREILLKKKHRGVQAPQRFPDELPTLRSTTKDEGGHPGTPQKHAPVVATPHAGVSREVQNWSSRTELGRASNVAPSVGISSLQQRKGLQNKRMKLQLFILHRTKFLFL